MTDTTFLKLGFSSCPNDTFIFGALANNFLESEPGFNVFIGDITELNQRAIQGELDIVKISAFAYLNIWQDYTILTTGGALGKGCGPIVVARQGKNPRELAGCKMAIPGKHTTAHFLLDFAGFHHGERIEMLFHQIMPSVKKGAIDAGVVIHEGRWTYHQFGLKQILDLGAFWEETTKLPLPLGVIAIKRRIDKKTMANVNSLIKKSIDYARKNSNKIWPFILKHAQEMDREIINRHIESFVNEYSLDLGNEGKEAIRELLNKACDKLKIQKPSLPLFWDDL